MFRSEDHRAYAAASESGVAGAADQGAAETWARVKRRLRAELGEDIFASWFGRLELESVVDGCAYLTVPTRFLKSWIESHYADRVLALYRVRGDRSGARRHRRAQRASAAIRRPRVRPTRGAPPRAAPPSSSGVPDSAEAKPPVRGPSRTSAATATNSAARRSIPA